MDRSEGMMGRRVHRKDSSLSEEQEERKEVKENEVRELDEGI